MRKGLGSSMDMFLIGLQTYGRNDKQAAKYHRGSRIPASSNVSLGRPESLFRETHETFLEFRELLSIPRVAYQAAEERRHIQAWPHLGNPGLSRPW